MPAYSYTALDISGIKKKGVLSAQSERDARKLIKELNLTPMTVQEAKGNLSSPVSYTHLTLPTNREV